MTDRIRTLQSLVVIDEIVRDQAAAEFAQASEFGAKPDQDASWDRLNEARMRLIDSRFALKCAKE